MTTLTQKEFQAIEKKINNLTEEECKKITKTIKNIKKNFKENSSVVFHFMHRFGINGDREKILFLYDLLRLDNKVTITKTANLKIGTAIDCSLGPVEVTLDENGNCVPFTKNSPNGLFGIAIENATKSKNEDFCVKVALNRQKN